MNIKRSKKVEESILTLLRKGHVLEVVCQQCKITRQTFSRWKREDAEFAQAVAEATTDGKEFLNDISEASLISAIKENNLTAVMYYLKHNHPSYKTRVEVEARILSSYQLSDEQKALVAESLAKAALPKIEKSPTNHGTKPQPGA